MGLNTALFPEATGAIFSDCRRYRYRLWRIWDRHLPCALFIMMNPSTADEVNDDPTVLRQQRRVMKWGDTFIEAPKVGGVEVVNVFAWRETDSTKLPGLVKAGTDIIGPDNDKWICDAASNAAIVICGWGQPGNLMNRGKNVLKLIHAVCKVPYALAINDDGTPRHPLYIGYNAKPVAIVCQ